MPRLTGPQSRLLAAPVLCLALAGLTTAASATGASPSAHASRACSLPRYPGLGYFTSLSVSNTSCATGDKVAVAYYHCRLHSGVKGRCHGGVLGFNCSEKRVSIPTEIDARVTCTRGSAKVVHTYQQDT
jgi:hypothetical protein